MDGLIPLQMDFEDEIENYCEKLDIDATKFFISAFPESPALKNPTP